MSPEHPRQTTAAGIPVADNPNSLPGNLFRLMTASPVCQHGRGDERSAGGDCTALGRAPHEADPDYGQGVARAVGLKLPLAR